MTKFTSCETQISNRYQKWMYSALICFGTLPCQMASVVQAQSPNATPDLQTLAMLIAANENAVDSAVEGQYAFTSYTMRNGKTVQSAGVARWDGEDARIEYVTNRGLDLEADSGSPDFDRVSAADRSVLILTSKSLLSFNPVAAKLISAIETDHQPEPHLQILPRQCWLTYDFQFPLVEILSANGTWDFSPRKFSIENSRETLTLRIWHPDHDGEITLTFDLSKGGLIRKVTNRKGDQVSYEAEYEWRLHGESYYPSRITMRNPFDLGDAGKTKFQLITDRYRTISNLRDRDLERSSIGPLENVTEIIYRRGREVEVRRPNLTRSEKKNLLIDAVRKGTLPSNDSSGSRGAESSDD